ncbi:MAG TPA: response regulator [Ktedonobacterales bacterium]|jgi:DNA-binding response OmpR family regulator
MRVQPPHPPRILVAEQDQSVAELLLAFLNGEGYKPSLAPSPENALKLIDEQTFHLVLTDLFIENARRPFSQVRRLLQRCPPTPVGLMTGWQVPSKEVERQGFAFLLQKPFDLDLVLAEITTCLHPTLTPEQEQQAQVLEHLIEATQDRNLETLGRLLTEDITYYPPRALPASARRVKGLEALLAYVQAAFARYENVLFDEFMFYPRAKGWAMRYCSHWPASDGSQQNLTGALLFHFRGERVYQIGIQWNDERLRTLLGI